MSTQTDIKTVADGKTRLGNIDTYTKFRLAGKKVCRPTMKPITRKLKECIEGKHQSC